MEVRVVRLNVVSETHTPILKNLHKMAYIENVSNYLISEI